MKYYNVSFQYSENVYCSNIAHAETVEDVEKHYSKYAWVKVSDASEYDVKDAQRRGKPIVECPHIEDEDQTEEPAAEEGEAAEETAENTEAQTRPASYEIRENEHFHSQEIIFAEKPSAEIREALKALKFRWNGKRGLWYGFASVEQTRAAIEGKAQAEEQKTPAKKTKKPDPVNVFGVKIGDIFSAIWGYEQTNNDYFQVVSLVGSSSVRVRQVHLPIISSEAVSGMSENRIVKVVRELLPPCSSSVFIKDQERGDLKRLKSYAADGKSNPQFTISSFADAHLVTGDTLKVYESWYA